jgi:hypothetical protein
VTWSGPDGQGGTASGTTDWSIDGITLVKGRNKIKVTATDASGNTATDTLKVTYKPGEDI